MSWFTVVGFAAITLIGIAVLLSDPYKRRRDSGDGGIWSSGDSDGGDCDGGGGD